MQTIPIAYPPLGIGSITAQYYRVKASKPTVVIPDLPLPPNTIDPVTFKQYLDNLSVLDTSKDGRINFILATVLRYFEQKTAYTVYNTSWKTSATVTSWGGFELDRKLINSITSIYYKNYQTWQDTQVLSLLPATFFDTVTNLTLPTYYVSEYDDRDPLILLDSSFTMPALYVEEDNIVINYITNPVTVNADLAMAMYHQAISLWNGCGDMPEFTQNVYNSYLYTSSTSGAAGLYVI